jgi:two-component system, chemotaxis family, CheB/CheR fusion protein
MPDAVPQPPSSLEDHLWVVAVGASAGGLEALQRFFSHLKPHTQAAFLVVQHLAPDHRSLMRELLTPHCQLTIQEAEDGQALLADHVYLMPPGTMMSIAQNRLAFVPRPPRGLSLPIDLLLSAMAQMAPERCVGVVLSGSGSDGALGAAALRKAGGYVMVQSPETAQFDSMPRAVLHSTKVDAADAPDKLAEQVTAITKGQSGRLPEGIMADMPDAHTALQRLFHCLLQRHGLDFSQYKLPTIMRRIERRMLEVRSTNIAEYAEVVEASAEESEALRCELLIPVTSFFRESEAFEALTDELARVIQGWPPERALRLWSAGCATGEEAYSLAMAAMTACERAQRWPTIKVFGTDVDQNVLDVASSGIYPATAAGNLNPELLNRYFNVDEHQISVKADLRRMVLFARHNLLEDPPFTKMDVVACRNMLIYLQAPTQERVMRRLQYALNAHGCLFLGCSESLGGLQTDFDIIHAGHKLYRLARPIVAAFAVGNGPRRSMLSSPAARVHPSKGEVRPDRLVELAQRQILRTFAPLCLLVTEQRQLLHAWGPTQRFLMLPEGSPRLDAIRMLPERLSLVAGHAFQQALQQQREVSEPPVTFEHHGQLLSARVHAAPLKGADRAEPCILLSIEELPAPDQTDAISSIDNLNEVELLHVRSLEQDLADTRASLQHTIEDLEAANEELQATNEELMSSNEELQSTNEELQSVNEELYTVNAEYNAKLEAVTALHADLDGMSQNTGVATLFVDQALGLIRFTPEAAQLFRLRLSDMGRPLDDFSNPLDYPTFFKDVRRVLDGAPPIETEVFARDGQAYIVRMLGYGESMALPRRLVISLIDVSRLKDAQRLQAMLDAMSSHIAVLDKHGNIVQVNEAWRAYARNNGGGGGAGMGLGTNYLAVLARSTEPGALDVLRGMQQVLIGKQPSYRVTYPCHSPTEKRWFVMYTTPLPEPDGGAMVVHMDISDWRRTTPTNQEAHHDEREPQPSGIGEAQSPLEHGTQGGALA